MATKKASLWILYKGHLPSLSFIFHRISFIFVYHTLQFHSASKSSYQFAKASPAALLSLVITSRSSVNFRIITQKSFIMPKSSQRHDHGRGNSGGKGGKAETEYEYYWTWNCCSCGRSGSLLHDTNDQCPEFECGHYRCEGCQMDHHKVPRYR
jgi:hypothetical protein